VEVKHYVLVVSGLSIVMMITNVYLWWRSRRNIYKATISVLTGALVLFLINAMLPSLEANVTINSTNIVPGVEIGEGYVTLKPASSLEIIALAIVAASVIIVFGLLHYLNDMDERKQRNNGRRVIPKDAKGD
jgi:hypothetical protein